MFIVVGGNRNVFIDYPEFAWLMFGMEPPADYETPSGMAVLNAHNWDEGSIILDATCTESGLIRFTCTDCGFTHDRRIPALGHETNTPAEMKFATCMEDGYLRYICSRCGQTLSEVLPATGHSFENGVCSVCGEALPMYHLSNTLSDGDLVIVYNPSAGAAMSDEIRNKDYRGYEAVSPEDDIIYTDSTAIVWTVSAGKDGFMLTASDGTVLATNTANSLPSDGKFRIWHLSPAVTSGCVCLFNDGDKYVEWNSKYADFASCDYYDEYESGLALQIYKKVICPHTHTELRSADATCIDDGYQDAEFCTDCGAKLTSGIVVPAHGHSFGAWIETIAPTCTESGTERRECAACDVYEQRNAAPLGHNYIEAVTAPTCEAQGYTVHTCSRCDDAYTDTYTSALGHALGEWQTVKEASCTENGERRRSCMRCEYYEAEVIAASCASSGFADVPAPENWMHKGIDFCIENGLMGSTSTDSLIFAPTVTCSRAMLVSILYRLAGSPETAYAPVFPDVKRDLWYTDAVIWAYQSGVVAGYDSGLFGPFDVITREQMAVILQKYSQIILRLPAQEQARLDSFPDADKVTWSRSAVQWAVAVGLISGRQNGTQTLLDPQGDASRAEIASLLMRYCMAFVK